MDSPKAVPEKPIGNGGVRFRPFGASGAFTLAAEVQGIRRLAVRGASATTLAQLFGLAIQIISTVILARLLTAVDFGLVTMVTTISLLLMNAGGNGITEAILQRKDLDHSLASNLFWINVGTGFVLTVAFCAAGSLMAWFYGNPRVAPIAFALSLTIILTSFSVLHLALLMRSMRFFEVYANQLFSRLVSVVVSVLLAWAGWGYWALVVGAVVQPLAEGVGAWSLCQWIPGLPRRVSGTGSMVRFALNVYGRFSFNYLSRNVDNLLVGWRFNAVALGFYKKAYDLFSFSAILKSYSPVAVSAMSRLSNDPERFKRHFLNALSISAFLGMGLGGALTLFGRDLIRVVLGPGWEPAGQIFTLFGPGFGIMFLYCTHGWIHVSIGRPDRWFKWGIMEFLVTALFFILSLPWGPAGVAASTSLSLGILTIPALWYAGRPIQLGTAQTVSAVWKFVLAALLAGCVTAMVAGGPFALAVPMNLIGTIMRIVKTCLLFGATYLTTVIILHGSSKPLYQAIGLLREMMPWGRSSRVSRVGVEPSYSEF